MSFLFTHSSVGTLIRYATKGNLDFQRKPGKGLSTSSSTDDLPFPPANDSIGTELKQHQTSLVDWSGPEDPSNPQNWPFSYKVVITCIIALYTFAVYVGSSIYTSSQEEVAALFGVSHVEGSLGLGLYVLGYGIGCLLFSPLSEIPAVGRNPPYAVSGFLFVVLCIPTALVNNFAGLMVCRFLLGFMASPCLATAGASLVDIWRPPHVPFAIALWAAVATLGPALGPTLSTYAVRDLGWRFSSWELMIIAGPVYLLMILFMPETSGPTILLYKAKRLRESTGNMNLVSDSERKQKDLHVGQMLSDALIKPWEINALDPAILFTTVYMGLAYGIYYSFFESLPLVYPAIYHFSAQSTALVFLCVAPTAVLAFIIHVTYLKYRVFPGLTSGTFGELENHLIPGMVASAFIPAGLFIYGKSILSLIFHHSMLMNSIAWTSRPNIHWMAPTIGLSMSIFGTYFIVQSIFLYIPNIYPRYAASIFAANSLARSLLAFASILFSRPMFESLGIDGGVSLLAGCMVLCSLGMVGLYRWGKGLRERSQFAQ
jgi:DHA1 family multidrug resistance protein-like MFS transporter